jgi:glycogen synthase
MKVLLYSHCFYPSIGGLETVSLTLADGFIQNHIEIKVVTKTASEGNKSFPFAIIRNPNVKQQIVLVKWADVVLFNGASLAMQPWVLLFRKPFVWVHTGYQVSCIDGLGWVEGKRAPIHPLRSIIYHKKLRGWLWAILQGVKLLIRRGVAKCLVSRNVAITEWMNQIQPLPRQIRIYNPFPTAQFCVANTSEHEFDFIYLGRIVSEKGILTLLKAFSKVCLLTKRPIRLLVIGDGNWRANMELVARELQILSMVSFVGNQSGEELVKWISKGKIAVIPSDWYEAMGGVALELMAAGKNLIVSEKGGLKECVGNAALTFPNGDSEALADRMIRLLTDASLREAQLREASTRIKAFNPEFSICQYIDLLKEVTSVA